MSANVYWRPKTKGKELPVNAPSSFLCGLKSAFGDLPITLQDKTHIVSILRRMEIKDSKESSSYEEIIDALGKHSKIEIFAEY